MNGTRHEVFPGRLVPGGRSDLQARVPKLDGQGRHRRRRLRKRGADDHADEGRKAGHADEHRGRHDLCPAVRRIKPPRPRPIGLCAEAATRGPEWLRDDRAADGDGDPEHRDPRDRGLIQRRDLHAQQGESDHDRVRLRRPADGAWRSSASRFARSATIPVTAPYTTDPAYSAMRRSRVWSCGAGPSYPNECTATRQATGADGKPYRINTYIVETTPVNGHSSSR